MERYIAFDVETPNYYNDRISAIGVTVIEDGAIVDDFYSLVDPETHFDPFNIALTGIRPELTRGKPAFPELWAGLAPVMGSGVLVAHNAPFDLGVLSKCLSAYRIQWRPLVRYACTCSMGRACYPELGNHRLNTLCAYLDIPLEHHNAGSDSRACAGLLLDYMRHGLDAGRYLRQYDLAARRTVPGVRK